MNRYTLDETKGDIRYEVEGNMLILKIRPEFISNIPVGQILDVIKTDDVTIPSDYNVFSAARVLKEIGSIKNSGKPTALYKNDLVTKYLYADEDKNTAYLTYNLLSSGDVIARATSDVLSNQYPVGSYTMYGLFKAKQDGGLLYDDKEGWYVKKDEEAGGIDEIKLKEYLDSHNYIYDASPTSKLKFIIGSNKPHTFLDGSGKFRAITEEDLGDFGDKYVTLDTDQTITGQKTFNKTILGAQDVIANSSGYADESGLPVGSDSKYGLLKYDNITLGVNQYGQLYVKNGGSGGSSDVSWGNSSSTGYEYLYVDNLPGREVALYGHEHSEYMEKTNTYWMDVVANQSAELYIKGDSQKVSLKGHTHNQYIEDINGNIKKLSGSGNNKQYLAGNGTFYTIEYDEIHGLSSNYVTIDTTQTVTGSKTFTQSLVSQRDVIANSSGGLSDGFPIASYWQYGLVKIDDSTIKMDGNGRLYAVIQESGGLKDETFSNNIEWVTHNNASFVIKRTWPNNTGIEIKGNTINGLSNDNSGNFYINWMADKINVKFDTNGKIYSNGNVVTSDMRLKTKISDISNVLKSIESLNAFIYTFKDDDDKIMKIGLSAQDVKEVFPQAVTLNYQDDGDPYYGIDYAQVLTAISVNGIKELHQLIKSMQTEINSLKDEINKLKGGSNDITK